MRIVLSNSTLSFKTFSIPENIKNIIETGGSVVNATNASALISFLSTLNSVGILSKIKYLYLPIFTIDTAHKSLVNVIDNSQIQFSEITTIDNGILNGTLSIDNVMKDFNSNDFHFVTYLSKLGSSEVVPFGLTVKSTIFGTALGSFDLGWWTDSLSTKKISINGVETTKIVAVSKSIGLKGVFRNPSTAPNEVILLDTDTTKVFTASADIPVGKFSSSMSNTLLKGGSSTGIISIGEGLTNAEAIQFSQICQAFADKIVV